MQPYTIGTSNNDKNKKGDAMISIEHNNREPEAVQQSNDYDRMHGRPPHIDVTKMHLNSYIIQCENELDAYEKTFGESVERFNAQQKRKDRRTTVEAELEKVKNNKKMQPLYEMIVQIGNKDYYPDSQICEKILKEYVEEFQVKFPNIKIVNATIHVDEATPHLHLIYIPFKTKEGQLRLQKENFEKLNPDNKEAFKPKQWKGMDMQPGLTAALEEMGYTNNATITYENEKGEMVERQDYNNGALAQWQKDFNGLLEKLCIKEGIPFHHPQAGKNVQHKETQEYKEDRIIHDKLKEEIKEKESIIEESDSIIQMNHSILKGQDEQISHNQEELNNHIEKAKKYKQVEDTYKERAEASKSAYNDLIKGQEEEYKGFLEYSDRKGEYEAELVVLDKEVKQKKEEKKHEEELLKETKNLVNEQLKDMASITEVTEKVEKGRKLDVKTDYDYKTSFEMVMGFIKQKAPFLYEPIMKLLNKQRDFEKNIISVEKTTTKLQEIKEEMEEDYER